MSLLKPIGATTTWIASPILPAIETSDCFWPGPGDGEARQRPQDQRGDEDDPAGALEEDRGALPQPDGDVAQARHLIFGQFHHEAPPPPFTTVRRMTIAASKAPTTPDDIEAEQDQALQADPGPTLRAGMKAPMISV